MRFRKGRIQHSNFEFEACFVLSGLGRSGAAAVEQSSSSRSAMHAQSGGSSASGGFRSTSADGEEGTPPIPFPFEPYDVQTQLMRKIYSTIEGGGIGIFESPTGTVRCRRCLSFGACAGCFLSSWCGKCYASIAGLDYRVL